MRSEYAINQRPLVYVSDKDLCESLTPFHLIFGTVIFRRECKTAPIEQNTLENCLKKTRNRLTIVT